MDVDIAFLKYRRIDAERSGAVLYEAQRGLRAFAHHIAKLAGENQAAFAGGARGFDEEDVTADRRPGEARSDARDAGAHGGLVLEAGLAQDFFEIAAGDLDLFARSLSDADGNVAEYFADLAF